MIGLEQLKGEMVKECEDVLAFWMSTSLDHIQGGFIGKLDNHGVLDLTAPKGLVLNARILWTFANTQNINENPSVEEIVKRAYAVLTNNFFDKLHGGYFWSLTYQNEPLNLRKQIYGQAFVVYAFAAYHKYTHDPEALLHALDLYRIMEKHAFDPVHGGYREAFAADWSNLEDMRLSPKDLNTPKSLNTHLHIMEAYVQLYQVWHDSGLVQKIKDLIDIFLLHFIDREAGHVHMFFDDDWQVIPAPWSYGHDIETSWLLYEAAEQIHYRLDEVKSVAILLAEGVLPVVDAEGGVAYESHLNQKHWWVQAEAMVGFMNAYQLTDEEKYIDAVYRIWDYTKKYIKDTENGEWFWGRNEDGSIMQKEDKIGFWKCPYHNVRACMQMSQRLKRLSINNKIYMKFYSWSILIFCLFWCLSCLPLSAQNKVSKISVSGNQFVKEDGSKYIFRGLNTSDPERLDTMGRWNEVYFDEMKKWGANVVRFPVHPTAWRRRGEMKYLQLLDKGVKWAAERGMYVIMDWHSIGNLKNEMYQHERYETTKKETFEFWRTIAKHYKDNATVAFYELFNEPTVYNGELGTCSWAEWKTLNEEMITIIRANGGKGIPLVAGFNWAYDLTEIANNPINATGIAYVSHPYPMKREKPWEEKWTQDWGFVKEKYPLILTEIGFCGPEDPGAHIPVISDESYGDAITKYCDQKDISWVVWVFDPMWAPALYTDWNYTPTRHGVYFKKALNDRKGK